jgi:hypothetical protein
MSRRAIIIVVGAGWRLESADLINKSGLGLVALIAARQISRDASIRQAMRNL